MAVKPEKIQQIRDEGADSVHTGASNSYKSSLTEDLIAVTTIGLSTLLTDSPERRKLKEAWNQGRREEEEQVKEKEEGEN